MLEQVGPAATLREFAEHAPELIELLPRLPSALLDVSTRMQMLQRGVVRQQQELRALRDQIRTTTRRRRRRAATLSLLLVLTLAVWQSAADTTQSRTAETNDTAPENVPWTSSPS